MANIHGPRGSSRTGRPAARPDLDAAVELMPARLWRIAVTVSWPGVAGSDRSIALATVRLAAKELTP